jgi:adenylate kinase
VSSGDLLREAVAQGTELGMKAKSVMAAGQLVSDDIVLGLIRERLSRPDAANGFILDGFPRNIEQANSLSALLEELGQPLDAVLLLDVRQSTLMERLAGRRICPKCGTVYNVHSMAPGATGCSKDGAELFQRPDDKEEVIGKRLEVYEQQTRPLVEHYSKLSLLRTVEGEGELEDVSQRMEAAALTRGAPAGKVKVRTSKAPAAAAKSAPVAKSAARKSAPKSAKSKSAPGKSASSKPIKGKPAAKKPAAKKSAKRVAAKGKSKSKPAVLTKRKAAKTKTKSVSKKAKRTTSSKRPARKK